MKLLPIILAASILSVASAAGSNDLDPAIVGIWGEGYNAGPVALQDNYAYLLGTGRTPFFLHVIDLADRANPREIAAISLSGTPQQIIVAGSYAYIAAGDAGLQIVDLTNPAAPVRLGVFDTRGSANSVAVENGRAYVAEYFYRDFREGGSPGALFVLDVSDPASPKQLGQYTFPDYPGYTAPLQISASSNIVSIASGRWKLEDESREEEATLDFIDVRNPVQPVRTAGVRVSGRVITASIAMSGSLAYWTSFTTADVSGTRRYTLNLYDVSNPAAPLERGAYSSTGEPAGTSVSGGYVTIAKATSSGTRSFDIVDVSNPATLLRTGGASLTGANFISGVATADSFAIFSAGSAGLYFYDVSAPSAPRRTAILPTAGTPAVDMAVSGELLLLMDWSNLHILNASVPGTLQRLGSIPLQSNEGASRFVTRGNYAYVAGSLGGFIIVDFSNPSAPRRVGLYRPSSAIADVAVSGNYAYLTDPEVGLHVMDISNPAAPRRLGGQRIRHSGSFYWIDVSGNHVFIGQSQFSGGSYVGVVEVFDVSDPRAPEWVGAYETLGPVNDVVAAGNYFFVSQTWFEDGNGKSHAALEVLDISDPANLTRVALYEPEGAYARGLTIRGNRGFLATTQHDPLGATFEERGVEILDISAPEQIRRVGGAKGVGWRTAVREHLLFGAQPVQGLMVLNTAKPAAVNKAAALDTPGQTYALTVASAHAYVAAGSEGLQIVDISDPAKPGVARSIDTPGTAWGVALDGSTAYVADGASGLAIIDIRNGTQPQIMTQWSTGGEARAVLLAGSVAYIANGSAGVQVLNVSNPDAPEKLGEVPTTGPAIALSFYKTNVLLVGAREAGLLVLDISNPRSPSVIANYSPGGIIASVSARDKYVYLSDDVNGFQVVDLSEITKPKRVGLARSSSYARGLAVDGPLAYVADMASGIQVYDVADPAAPRLLGGNSSVDAYGLVLAQGKLFAASGLAGLTVFDAYTLPLTLQAARANDGTVSLRIQGHAQSARLQRSNDLKAWSDWKTVQATESSVAVEAGALPAAFFRVVAP